MIHELDLHYQGVPGAIAAWLVEGPSGAVLIESGPECVWPALVEGLRRHGLSPGDLAAVLLTHIHLDHAGAAWRLAAEGVPIHVHEVGAKHLIDPAKLISSATRIYGDTMERLWGSIEPCPASFVHAAQDGDRVSAGGLEFQAIETPGHASHHHCWSLEGVSPATLFTGDVAAMLIPGTRWISLPMPPPELDRDAWMISIDRINAGNWTRLCLTHGGQLVDDEIPTHLEGLRIALDSHIEFITERLQAKMSPDDLKADYRAWLRDSAAQAGIGDEVFDQFVTQGLVAMSFQGVKRLLAGR